MAKVVAVLVLLLCAPATAFAQSGDCTGPAPGTTPEVEPPAAGLRFGMYPGGVAGQLGAAPAAQKPDDPAKVMAALADLRPPDGPFVVHLYRSYLSDESDAEEEQVARRLVDRYTSAGYLVEFVVRYRRDDDVDGYVRFLRGIVDRFGSNPRVVGLQVANEVNFEVSPDSSDGAYSGAPDALVQGVIAAKDQASARGYRQLEIGFNWVYRLDPSTEQRFWAHLRDAGGAGFAGAVDWVGLDAYPGTFFPPVATADEQRTAMVNALDELRCYLEIPGVPERVPIHVAENGYATGPGRSYEMQTAALEAMVGAVAEHRGTYNVSDYRWFDLRDADSSSPNFQQQYGLMRDDYTPKHAYASWRRLIRELSVTGGTPEPAPGAGALRLHMRVRCYGRGVRARLVGAGVRSVTRVVWRARGTRVVDLRRPWRRSVRLRPRDRRRRLAVTALATLREGGRLTLTGRSPRCG
ncbi:MAG: hypothetical protein QOH30_664 [Baekduia sp.]|nr:hypothetical protein [Baekduia sp.]